MRRRLWLIEVARVPGPVEQRGDAVARPSSEDIAPVCVRRCASRARRSGWAALGDPTRRARVLAYEPPDRVVISWDISPQWRIETDVEKTSEVEVRFISDGPKRTRVELEHRNLERHGDGWKNVRDGVAGDQGWPLYLRRYSEQLAKNI